jgi:hypothetical protein
MKTLYQGFGATRIIEDRNLVDYVEDRSKVRSPSRARRRLKRGFRQNIVMREVAKSGGAAMTWLIALLTASVGACFLRRQLLVVDGGMFGDRISSCIPGCRLLAYIQWLKNNKTTA